MERLLLALVVAVLVCNKGLVFARPVSDSKTPNGIAGRFIISTKWPFVGTEVVPDGNDCGNYPHPGDPRCSGRSDLRTQGACATRQNTCSGFTTFIFDNGNNFRVSVRVNCGDGTSRTYRIPSSSGGNDKCWAVRRSTQRTSCQICTTTPGWIGFWHCCL